MESDEMGLEWVERSLGSVDVRVEKSEVNKNEN